MTPLYVAGGALLLVALWGFGNYNGLVRLRNHCREAWSNVDSELKRRHNLIPNLVEAVRGYAKHEQRVLEAVARARSAALSPEGAPEGAPADASPEAQARQENALAGSLRQLLAVAEAYPELRASEHFLALQRELANTEDRIQAARRFYNANVRDFNTRCEVFPAAWIARWGGFQRAEYFQVEAVEVRAPVKVNL